MTVSTVGGDQLNTSSRRVSPGWYHAVLTQVKETEKCDGIAVHGDVLAGKANDPKETEIAGATFQLTFWVPDASKSEEQQNRTNARLTALLVATDLVPPDKLGQPIAFEPESAVGRHVLVHLRYKQKKVEENGQEKWVDDTRYLDLAFNDILHVDDPAGHSVPKNVGAMKFIPPQLRHLDAKYFAFKAKPGSAEHAPAGTAGPTPGSAMANSGF